MASDLLAAHTEEAKLWSHTGGGGEAEQLNLLDKTAPTCVMEV